MANTINWGKIYCFTEWGEEDHTIVESIPAFSAPSCFTTPTTGVIDSLVFSADRNSFADATDVTADKTLI